MQIIKKRALTTTELLSAIKKYDDIILDEQNEIKAKEFILENAYRDIKRGHPHYPNKLEMITQLNLDRLNLKGNIDKRQELSDQVMSILN